MAIPSKLRPSWTFLHTQVLWLHGRWELFNQLYGESPKRMDFLNRTAPTFFALLQGILLNDLQLTLSKLADPATLGIVGTSHWRHYSKRSRTYPSHSLRHS